MSQHLRIHLCMRRGKGSAMVGFIKRNFSFSGVLSFLIILGLFLTYIGYIRLIPSLEARIMQTEKDCEANESSIQNIKVDIDWIKKGVERIERKLDK